MKEVKQPRKPLIYYYLIVIAVLSLVNTFITPMLFGQKVQETDYGSFLQMVDAGDVSEVEIDDSYIVFKDQEDVIYKTGKMDDPQLTEKLYDSEVKFNRIITEPMSPILSFLISFIIPLAIFGIIGQFVGKKLMKNMQGGRNAMQFGKSNAKVYVQSSGGIKFDDVAGQEGSEREFD